MTTTSPASHSWVQQCTVCGTGHDRDKLHDGLCHGCVSNKLQAAMAELERVNKAAAEMRHDLIAAREMVARFLIPWKLHIPDSWLDGFVEAKIVSFDGMAYVYPVPVSTDAGKDYVRREDVKPLVEALRALKLWLDKDPDVVKDALAHAKEKGFA